MGKKHDTPCLQRDLVYFPMLVRFRWISGPEHARAPRGLCNNMIQTEKHVLAGRMEGGREGGREGETGIYDANKDSCRTGHVLWRRFGGCVRKKKKRDWWAKPKLRFGGGTGKVMFFFGTESLA